MKSLFFAAALTILPFMMTAQAQDFRTTCPAMPTPSFTLDTRNVPVRLVEGASQETMKTLFQENNPTGAMSLSQHQTIGGLHSGEIQLRTEFQMLQASLGGRACLGLKELVITLGYEPVIYISEARPRGTCEYDAAIEHEYKHLNTDLAILREAIPRLRTAAQRSLNQLPPPRPMPEGNLTTAREQLQARITAVLDREMTTIETERNRRQALIDTPAEYQRVANQCAG